MIYKHSSKLFERLKYVEREKHIVFDRVTEVKAFLFHSYQKQPILLSIYNLMVDNWVKEDQIAEDGEKRQDVRMKLWGSFFKNADIEDPKIIREIMADPVVGLTQLCGQMISLPKNKIGMSTKIVNAIHDDLGASNLTVLDFGCGNPDDSLSLAVSEMCKHVILCDLPGMVLDFADWRFNVRKDKTRCTHLAIESDKFIGRIGLDQYNMLFDFINAREVFEHLRPEDSIKWFERFSRILKPDGLLHIPWYPVEDSEVIGDHLQSSYDGRIEVLDCFESLFVKIRPRMPVWLFRKR